MTRYRGLAAQVKPTKTRTRFANVAGHNSMEGRQIVVEETLNQFKEKPGSTIHTHGDLMKYGRLGLNMSILVTSGP